MSTANFDSLDSPSHKRSRPHNEPPAHSADPQEGARHCQVGPTFGESLFRAKKLRPFTELNCRDECVVGDAAGSATLAGRHLCSSPQHAAATVSSHANDNELLNNGDSGFQELNIPDEYSLDVNEGSAVIAATNSDDNSLIEPLITGQDGSKEFDDDDSISELSCASDISNISGEDWKPVSNHIKWIHMQIEKGTSPKEIIRQLTGEVVSDEIDDISALRFIVRLLSDTPSVRSKLNNVNTIEDVISLIQKSSKIIILTGAGVSVSCGIPDFRSRNGIYARLSKDYPDLPDPQSMFDIHYFKRNPYPFFKFAKEIYPGQFSPSPSHKFIKYIERKGKLLRNYSQNIDTLEKAAGIERVITCHGSFATATCTNCGFKVDSNAIKADIFSQHIPLCPKCNVDSPTDSSIMPVVKPDIVFFGEGLSDEFHNSMTIDKDQCDLLIVIGSSLKVRPVALIPNSIPEDIPQILINREPLSHLNFDVELLGDCDIIIENLCERLGQDWTEFCFSSSHKSPDKEAVTDEKEECVYNFLSPSRYVFKGAELTDSGPDEEDNSENTSDESESDDEVKPLSSIDCDETNDQSISQLSILETSSFDVCFTKQNGSENEESGSGAKDVSTFSFSTQNEKVISCSTVHSAASSIHLMRMKQEESIEDYSLN